MKMNTIGTHFQNILLLTALFAFTALAPVYAGGPEVGEPGGPEDANVKIIHAEGRIFYNEIYVNWLTEYETAPFEFVIEKSNDGKKWLITGKVKSHAGSGHGEYEYVEARDDKFKFYRIRKLDRKGMKTLKEIELVDYSIDVQLKQINVNHDKRLAMVYSVDKDQELLVRIYDRLGEQVVTRRMPFSWAGDFIYHLDISNLRSGNYLLVVTQTILDKSVAEQSFTLR